MHRVVIYSEPVVIKSEPFINIGERETLYGRLYSGETEADIIANATYDLKRLVIQEQWEGKQGDEFREKENWTLVHHKDGTESWSFDADKYTNNLGYGIIVDQFVENCWTPPLFVGLISGWVPLRMVDCNDDDYIINRAFYDSINEANPNHVGWILLDKHDDLPF